MGIDYSHLANTKNESLHEVSFPNCYINLSVKLALAKVKAGKQKPWG